MARPRKHGDATVAEVRRRKLPEKCECGGTMLYSFSFDRVWSVCDTCTPVETVNMNVLRTKGDRHGRE